MVNYNLEHLTQPPDQRVIGPIQDDEALFLFSVVRASRLRTILEFGGLSGYSARNFLAALDYDNYSEKIVFTCEVNLMQPLAPNHRIIQKPAAEITKTDLDSLRLDMIFFDCHSYEQMTAFYNLRAEGIITDQTIIALHDTNLHYFPYHMSDLYMAAENGFVHEPVEKTMVEMFREMGYNIFHIRTDASRHHDDFPFRHGVTLCQK
jgi:predicted O-methyltransferase YrrM